MANSQVPWGLAAASTGAAAAAWKTKPSWYLLQRVSIEPCDRGEVRGVRPHFVHDGLQLAQEVSVGFAGAVRKFPSYSHPALI